MMADIVADHSLTFVSRPASSILTPPLHSQNERQQPRAYHVMVHE